MPTAAATPADLDRLATYDRPRFGGDRRPVLALLLTDPSCRTAVAERDGTLVGYAVARVDEPRLGPLVADDSSVAASLLRWAFAALPGTDEMRLNLPPGNRRRSCLAPPSGESLRAVGRADGARPDVPRRDDTIYQ